MSLLLRLCALLVSWSLFTPMDTASVEAGNPLGTNLPIAEQCALLAAEAFESGDICVDFADGLWNNVWPYSEMKEPVSTLYPPHLTELAEHGINGLEDINAINQVPMLHSASLDDLIIYDDGSAELWFTHPHFGKMVLTWCLQPALGCTVEHKPISIDFIYDGLRSDWQGATGFEVGDLLFLDLQ